MVAAYQSVWSDVMADVEGNCKPSLQVHGLLFNSGLCVVLQARPTQHWFALIQYPVSRYFGDPLNWGPGVPKLPVDWGPRPHSTGSLGTPGPQFTGIMGTPS